MTKTEIELGTPNLSDRPAILSVLRDAFDRNDEADLVENLWAQNAITSEYVAKQDGITVGYCAYSAVTSEPPIDQKLLGLAPVAVASNLQQSGIGTALVQHSLHAQEAGAAALIVVLGEPEYYARFGFKPAAQFNVAWAAMDAGDAFQLIDNGSVTNSTPHKIDYHPAFSEV